MRRNSGRRSFSVWPCPRSRATAVDLSPYSSPMPLLATLKIELWTNCG